jgi:hypothetical protein
MKVYGYSESIETESPLTLSEVTLSTNPNELREIAKFLNQVANKIDESGDNFEHEHLAENFGNVQGPNFIVYNEDAL